jgi:protein associated with RNAse G/E
VGGSKRISAGQTILVRALKHDGSAHRSWPAQVTNIDGPLIVLSGEFDQEIEHDLLGTIAQGTLSIEYYWLDRWYNVFRFLDAERRLRNFYCNINKPPEFDGKTLSYVDLDIDVLVQPAFTYTVLDVDEFEHNALHYQYPRELQANVHRALGELIKLIETRAFPFDE